MSSTSEAVNVHLLDREYTVGVDPSERTSLMAAARLLDSKMREVRGSNRMAAVDRVAVLAALNLAHELQMLRDQLHSRDKEIARLVDDINLRVERSLGSP